MSRIEWTVEKIKEEALKYKTRYEFEKNSPNAHAAARRRKIVDEVCGHMIYLRKTLSDDAVLEEMRKYKTKIEFKTNNNAAYQQALKRNLLNKHIFQSFFWTNEELALEAKKYKYKKDFKKHNDSAYNTAYARNILNDICSHMKRPPKLEKYTETELAQEALKYNSKIEFKNSSPSAYRSAIRKGIMQSVSSHMTNGIVYWTDKMLQDESLKYNTRGEFIKGSKNAWQIARKRGLLDSICIHMGKSGGSSIPETNLFDIIKQQFPKAQKFRDRKAKIADKPHIKGFDMDIYIPELRKGIEFDGVYWHSVAGLKRSREDWPEEDLKNYHQIKDGYFRSKNIIIFHIKEEDWLKNQNKCLDEVFAFLKN